jgi:hypothetical protein
LPASRYSKALSALLKAFLTRAELANTGPTALARISCHIMDANAWDRAGETLALERNNQNFDDSAKGAIHRGDSQGRQRLQRPLRKR